MFLEITFTSGFDTVIQRLAAYDVKLTAYAYGLGEHRIVIDPKFYGHIRQLVPMITNVTPAVVIPYANRPGGLHEILQEYGRYGIIRSYLAVNQMLVLVLRNMEAYKRA